MVDTKVDTKVLSAIADIARLANWRMVYEAKSGHFGGGASMAEILACLYFGGNLFYRPDEPNWPLRDRVIVKGHPSALFYSILQYAGYAITDKDRSEWRKIPGALLQGHVELGVPGVEYTAARLGQTLSFAVGEALYAKRRGLPYKVFVVMGDGDNQKGQYKEAAVHAAHLKLDNLVVIYDYNGKQIEGDVSKVDSTDPRRLWEAYGFGVVPANGHDIVQIQSALQAAVHANDGCPALVLAHTVKGYGVSVTEAKPDGLHGSPPTDEEYAIGVREIEDRLNGFDQAAFLKWLARTEIPGRNNQTRDRAISGAARPVAEVSSDKPKYYAIGTDVSTRKAFGEALLRAAKADPSIWAMSADLTGSVGMTKFQEMFSDRFVPLGVSEAHMAGFAAGLAKDGKVIPFTGTFDVFSQEMTSQITLIAMMGLPAVFVFTHSGTGVGEDGATHQSTREPVFFRDLPNTASFEPCDANETVELFEEVLRAARQGTGPVYLRLTRQAVPVIYRGPKADAAAGAYIIRNYGKPKLIVAASGALLTNAVLARDISAPGLPIRVINVTRLDRLASGMCDTRGMFEDGVPVVTLHDASPYCLGDAVLRELNRLNVRATVDARGIKGFGPGSGPSEKLYKLQGFDVGSLTELFQGCV